MPKTAAFSWNTTVRQSQVFSFSWNVYPRQSVLVVSAWAVGERYNVLFPCGWNTMTGESIDATMEWIVGQPFQTTILQLPAVQWKSTT